MVSIITPFFNIEPDIFAETVQSVRQQTLQQLEWIIVNDGSTQRDALYLLDILARQDPRVKIIHLPENRGLSAARNAGLQASRADFAVLLDGDDLLEPTAVEKWFWFLFTRPQLSFTRGYSVRFGETPHLWERSFEDIEAFLTKNQMEPTAMVRREAWQQTGGFDEAMRLGLEDWEFWLKCAAHGFWGATVPEYLNWYRLRSQQHRRWPALKNDETRLALRDVLQQRYPALFAGQLPSVTLTTPSPPLPALQIPCVNTLAKPASLHRILLITVTLDAALQAGLMESLSACGGLSICATQASRSSDLAKVARFTPDVFVLPNFLQPYDYPRFLHYFIASRQVDGVLIHRSRLGYNLLPYLNAQFPRVVGVDYVDGDATVESSVRCRAWLVHTLTNSAQLRTALLTQDGTLAQTAVESCVNPLNIDWRELFSQLKPKSGSPTEAEVSHLLAALAVESCQTSNLAPSVAKEENRPIKPISNLSGEEVAGALSGKKLMKALGFKLGSQRGLRWLYRLKGFAKWLLGEPED